MSNLGVCKTCKAVVAHDAKACPHCGQSNPSPTPITKRPVAMLVLVVFGLLVVSAVLGSFAGRDYPAVTRPVASVAAIPTPAPPPAITREELTAAFKSKRADLVTRLNATLKSKEGYSVLFVAAEYQDVADTAFLDLLNTVSADKETTAAASLKQFEAKEKQAARKRGVSLGMTKAQALASNWGKPQNINRTTRVGGGARTMGVRNRKLPVLR